MAHVRSLKELVGPDLNALITHITGCQEGSNDFKKLCDLAWSSILYRNVPSVNDRQVQRNAYEFIDKFKFHNFPQKAINLKILLDEYSKLPYFKKYTSGDVQWGLIKLLIHLSYKPTSALVDDQPLSLPLASSKRKLEFDWGSYLKEGCEKFCLPSSSEDEFSDLSDDELKANSHVEDYETNSVHLSHTEQSIKWSVTETTIESFKSFKSEKQELKEAFRDASDAEKSLKVNVQYGWWSDPCFREPKISNHPIANCTFRWEKQQKELAESEGLPFQDLTIISECKVMREVLWVLGRPCSGYLFKKDGNKFSPCENFATPTIIPPDLRNILMDGVCRYLTFIWDLQQFCKSIFGDGSPHRNSFTFNSYASSLSQMMIRFRKTLSSIENRLIKQEESLTILALITEVYPWLHFIEEVWCVHNDAVYENWRTYPAWQYSFRLLAILFKHIQFPKNRLDHGLLDIFLGAFWPYARILGRWLGVADLLDVEDEFIIARPKDEPHGSQVVVRDYRSVIADLDDPDFEFWDTLVHNTMRAGTAIDFLVQLCKVEAVLVHEWSLDSFFNDFLANLEESLLADALIPLAKPMPPIENPLVKYKEQKEKEFTPFSREVASSFEPIIKMASVKDKRILTGSLMDECFMAYVKKPPVSTINIHSCKFLLKIKNQDLSRVSLFHHVKKALEDLIQKFVPPRGFVKEILLTDLMLLKNLASLRKVYFLQAGRVMHMFCSLLFNHLDNKTLGTVPWSAQLIEFLSEEIPTTAHRFNIELPPELSSEICADKQQKLNSIYIYYKPDDELKIIITKSMITCYNKIFQFLLQLKWAFFNLYKISFRGVIETDKNRLRLRRLYSLRMWMLSTMTSLHGYFVLMRSASFDFEMSRVCEVARDVKVISSAHKKGLEIWMDHCFISEGHPATKILLELFSLCAKVRSLWDLECSGFLADNKLEQLEAEYSAAVVNLAEALKIVANKPNDLCDHFGILYDDIMNNIPVQ